MTAGAENPGSFHVVQAAGGVVWRSGVNGIEAVAVHRPHYGDWSLPKGKIEGTESHLEAALREVEEETGLVCEPEVELSAHSYVDHRGRSKRVRWWAMRPVGGSLRPGNEVDDVRWFPVAEPELLDREADRLLLIDLTKHLERDGGMG